MMIASELIVDGRLNINIPEPPKFDPTKKKKKKKKAQAEEPEDTSKQLPIPEGIQVQKEIVNKLFLLSQKIKVDSSIQTQNISPNGYLCSIEELGEFLFRVADHVFSEQSYKIYDIEPDAVPKEVSQMFARTKGEKLEKVLLLAQQASNWPKID